MLILIEYFTLDYIFANYDIDRSNKAHDKQDTRG
jgi:hypothetical protein